MSNRYINAVDACNVLAELGCEHDPISLVGSTPSLSLREVVDDIADLGLALSGVRGSLRSDVVKIKFRGYINPEDPTSKQAWLEGTLIDMVCERIGIVHEATPLTTTHDFGDGQGPVPAYKHPNGGGWVADTADVGAFVFVGPHAKVFGSAKVSDYVRVTGSAQVFGTSRVSGRAIIYGYAKVGGRAQIGEGASIADGTVF